MNQKIQVLMHTNEKGSGRDTALARAIMDDPRFSLPEFVSDINVDVQFRYGGHKWIPELVGKLGRKDYDDAVFFNCELKEAPDYVSTVLGPNGHGAMQYLDMAEAGQRCMFLVLGSDADVSNAIMDSLKTRYRGSELGYQIASYEKRLIDFEAQCEALGCPVRRWKAMPYSRLLSTTHKILTGASLAGYGPRPKANEREVFAANCLFRGIGEKTLAEVLKEYRLALVPRGQYARPVEEIKGVGEKRAKDLNSRIVMFYGAI